MSKSLEAQEEGIHSEGSRKNAKKDRRKTSGGKEDIVTPISSQPIERLVTKKFVVGEPTTSRKRKSTQSQKISPTSIQKDKIQKKDSELGG
jgi:ribosomal protein S8E